MTQVLVVLLLLPATRSSSRAEFSLISARRTVLEPIAATSRRAQIALRAMSEIPLAIAGAQLGVTICSLGLGAIAEPALAHLLVAPFEAVGLPHGAVHPVAFILGLGIVVFGHTVIGEMVPKNLTLASPETAVVWLGPPMLGFCIATKPLLVTMKWLSRQVLRIWRVEATDSVKTVYTTEELADSRRRVARRGTARPGGARSHHRRAGPARSQGGRRGGAVGRCHHRG